MTSGPEKLVNQELCAIFYYGKAIETQTPSTLGINKPIDT